MVLACGVCESHDTAPTLSAACPAKLNVFLEVLGRRADGFHELESVMVRTDFADRLSVRLNSTGELSLRFSDSTPSQFREGVPLDNRNLILRAAALVRDACGTCDGADFVLHKLIPPQSGLGGGSSNAATALKLSRQLWHAPLTDRQLHEIAARLGSDVNFLLSGYPAAICRGRGEVLEPIQLKRDLHFVSLKPRSGNSTAEVFRSLPATAERHSVNALKQSLEAGLTMQELTSHFFNRLTGTAQKLNVEMRDLMHQVRRVLRRSVLMSGSGSTIFVSAESALNVQRTALLLETRLNVHCWRMVCRAKPDTGELVSAE